MPRAALFVLSTCAATIALGAFAQESPDSIVEESSPATQQIESELRAPMSVPAPAAPANDTTVSSSVAETSATTATVTEAEEEGALDTSPIPAQPMSSLSGIRLRVLDKVTARISVLEGPLGGVQNFGNLEIITRVCWKAPPTAQPDNAALLDIYERKAGASPQRIFTGWMFSSSPAISALEHPVYDITVLECREAKSDAL